MGNHPIVIQGGMGAGISNWRLARAVSELGQLGVVSGTALDQILARRLQDGDPGGHICRAFRHFPFPRIASRIWNDYYIRGGKPPLGAYKREPQLTVNGPREAQELCIAGNFVEVFLARESHDNPVGINYLEKLQLPHLADIYGAMLAGVDYVLMGAGIPLKIPGVLDRYVNHEPATYPLSVSGPRDGAGETGDAMLSFDPHDFMECELPPLRRPKFLAIIASNTLALTMVRKANGRVDGFVVEGPTAGGHNAPPRGKLQLSEEGEPVYGERDRVDLAKLRELNLPFWLAGGYGTPDKLQEALAAGAAGVQVGTVFAFCNESGLRDDYKHELLAKAFAGTARVRTDPIASPTNFPFKVAVLEGTVSEREDYLARPRICDLGYLREAYRTPEGKIDFRCASEPVSVYVSKGGDIEDTEGRKCLCNALMSNIGLTQVRNGKHIEKGMVTAGDDLVNLRHFLGPEVSSYSAADVLKKWLKV